MSRIDPKLTRRGFLGATGGVVAAGAGLSLSATLAPTKAYAAEMGPIKIANIESFIVEIPVKPAEAKAGVSHRFNVVRVTTDSGVRGYSFTGALDSGAFAPSRGGPAEEAAAHARLVAARRAEAAAAFQKMRSVLIGADLLAVEKHLQAGLGRTAQIEEAMWDAIGKAANQPVHRLLGGAKALSIPTYLTYVWPGGKHQSHIATKEQGRHAGRLRRAGFKAMKIRMFRPRFMDDVEACREMLAAGGPGFRVMVDRTAASSGSLWDYATALAAARALEEAGVYWLEEPFDRSDYESPARLRLETKRLLITGGEGYSRLEPYRECLMHRSFDILQPDLRIAGGVLNTRKIAILSEAFDVPIIQHGTEHGLPAAGRLQVAAAAGTPMFEFISVAPPLTPQEQWEPALKILNQMEVFAFRNGEVQVPTGPGLGLDLNEEAIDRYRIGKAA